MDFLLRPPEVSRDSDYKSPPLDGSLPVPELYDWHLENNPDHPVIVFANKEGTLTRLTFSDVVPAAHRAGRYVAGATCANLVPNTTSDPSKLTLPGPVAILAATDTVAYLTTLVGMLRAGITTFPISPRNSVAGVVHLLVQTKPSYILVSPEGPIQDLVHNALAQMEESHPQVTIEIRKMPTYEFLYKEEEVAFERLPPRQIDYNVPRLIVHSSGSSSFPKPIIWNDKYYLQVAVTSLFGASDLCGKVIACHGVPMFHAIGLSLTSWVAAAGITLATFAPSSPAVTPNPESVFRGILQTTPSYVFGVPAFIGSWSRDPSKVASLKKLEGLIYGGGPLEKTVGDALSTEGVEICTLYGTTEHGGVAAVFSPKMGLDWEYFVLNPSSGIDLVSMDDGSYEVVFIEKPTQVLNICNGTFRGHNAFYTNDLIVPHPTKSGCWKVAGRKDDQIMLSTGEKTNPVPLENMLCQHPKVKAAVMFGRGRFQNGVLIELEEQFVFDPKESSRLVSFREEIWPVVDKVNEYAPSHSRLFKEMILVSDAATKPFAYTPKGTPKRALILQDYESEIDNLYKTVEETTQSDLVLPPDWSVENSLNFVRAAVNNVLVGEVNDEEDIFQRGCDSLQSIWIRNSIVHALRSSGIVLLPAALSNVVYENPTVASLASRVSRVALDVTAGQAPETKAADLTVMLDRYTSHFPKHVRTSSSAKHGPTGDVVLVTGTTGSLGAAVLAKLIQDPVVTQVYALNRPSGSGVDLSERQRVALKSRGYDEGLVASPKLRIVEGILSGSGLGIERSLENEIRDTVTHIIHIAWPVNFKLSISSFENTIGGVRSLIDFALQSPLPNPPRIIFISSVGVLRNVRSATPIRETALDDPSTALGQGYSESKWIAESMLQEAAKHTVLRPIVIRVGQISGGLNGAWNASDWVPSLIKSSLTLGCLPDVKGTVSWIPLDLAANAVVDMRNTQDAFAHLAHPRPTEWATIFEVVGKDLSLPLRPFSQWYEALEAAWTKAEGASTKASLPAGMILDIFKAGLDSEISETGIEAMGLPVLDMTCALRASGRLQAVELPLDSADVRSWIRYWREIEFLPVA